MGRDRERLRRLEDFSFQFTRPAWGATVLVSVLVALVVFQFTRPAWGATSNVKDRG